MDNRDRRILEKIAGEIAYLDSLLRDVSLDAFLGDETVKRASAMASINIGELAKHLSATFYDAHPGTSLRYAAKTRDVYAHGYYCLSFETVYKTAQEDYPQLKSEIEQYLRAEYGK